MKIKSSIIFVLVMMITLPSACSSSNHKESSKFYLVTKVVDGDTFWVDDGSEKGLKIRLIGVDAPESRRTGRKEIGYYGKEAKEFLKSYILNKKVRLEFDLDKYDKYQRVLAYAYLNDGTFLNAYLLKGGYAKVMTVPPNDKYSKYFLKLQQEARLKNRGLWSK